MRLGLAAAAMLAALCSSSLAFADDAQPDSVFLRNGTSARGHISEMIAYDHVTIVLPGGETKRIPWAEVEHVLVGSQSSFGPPAPPSTPPEKTKAEPSARTDDDYVHVHFTASGRGGSAFLYREPAGTMDWVTVCEAPCDADVPLHDRYRIGGNGNPTRDVKLKGTAGGSIALHADGRNTTGIVFGWILMATGSIVGLAAMGGDDHGGVDAKRYLVVSAVGAAVLISGIILYVKSASTEIEQRPATEKRPDEASVRRPVWRTLSAQEEATPPATFPVVFERSF